MSGIKKVDFKAMLKSKQEEIKGEDFSDFDSLTLDPEIDQPDEPEVMIIPEPKKSKPKKKPAKKEDSLVIDESQFAAIQFALNKCLNLFQSERFDAPSSPTFYFKKEWKKILEEIENHS